MMKTLSFLATFVLGLGLAHAQPARQAYKHVDEQGNVTYSQTPPAKDAQAIRLPPPQPAVPHAAHEELRQMRRQARQDAHLQRQDYERHARERQAALEEARKQRYESLRAECVRNRGTDCDDPATIARMQAERGPSQYRPRVPR
jgi:type IV secretory pathway VirB10-like protein